MTRWSGVIFIAFAFILVIAPPSSAENFLNVQFARMDIGGGATAFGIWFGANKDGAATAELFTPLGTYPCISYGSSWYPDLSGSYFLDHSYLSWIEFAAAISENWILIWDVGLATETVANIGFGSFLDSEFPPRPVIIFPVAGVDYPEGVSLVEWNFGSSDPCIVPVSEVWVNVHEKGVGGYNDDIFGPLGCDATSVELTIPSSAAQHTVIVTHLNYVRPTAEGIGGLVTGDPWILEREYWLIAYNDSQLAFNGPVVETEGLSFGSLKAMYR